MPYLNADNFNRTAVGRAIVFGGRSTGRVQPTAPKPGNPKRATFLVTFWRKNLADPIWPPIYVGYVVEHDRKRKLPPELASGRGNGSGGESCTVDYWFSMARPMLIRLSAMTPSPVQRFIP
jgi:hypothetical protein